MRNNTSFSIMMLPCALFGSAGCSDHGIVVTDEANEPPNAHVRVALQADDPATNLTNGLKATVRVSQNPADNCSPNTIGPLIAEETTEMTDASLLFALVGDPTSADGGLTCEDGRRYCLEIVEDDPLVDDWSMFQALDTSDLDNPLSWQPIVGPVTMISANPQSFEVCEGLATSVQLEFNIGNGVIRTGVGIADIGLVTTEINCGQLCTTVAENVGDPVCVLMNVATNPAATPECKPSCENHADCNPGSLCVGGETPFAPNNPGYCVSPDEVLNL